DLAMQVLMAAFLVWTLLSPQGRGTEAWPTHTACRDGSLQVLYQSCGLEFTELQKGSDVGEGESGRGDFRIETVLNKTKILEAKSEGQLSSSLGRSLFGELAMREDHPQLCSCFCKDYNAEKTLQKQPPLFSLEHLAEPGRYQAPVTQEPQAGSALSISGESSRKARSRGVLVKHTVEFAVAAELLTGRKGEHCGTGSYRARLKRSNTLMEEADYEGITVFKCYVLKTHEQMAKKKKKAERYPNGSNDGVKEMGEYRPLEADKAPCLSIFKHPLYMFKLKKQKARLYTQLWPDALQDFGFSVDQCPKQLKPNLNIRFGIILREDVEELFLDVALFSKGLSILNFSYPICEADLPKFSFCGRRKGEGDRQELAAEVRTPRPASGFPPSPVDELHLTYHHVLYKNDRTAHPTGPAFRGSVNIK
ncbi:hypothetical protein E2I00_000529, partial [Balaenoptera physalus]